MKLTSVEIHAQNSPFVLTLSFRDPGLKDAYNVKAIVGLDADEIVSQYYSTATNSLTKFNNLSLLKRSVTFKIGLNPRWDLNENYSNLRDNVYKILSSSRTGRIQVYFKNGDIVVATLSGFVTKLEAPQFEQVQEVQMTMKCDDPVLRAPSPVNIDTTGMGFTNIIVQDDISTAPHGFKFELELVSNLAAILTMNDPTDPSWVFSMTSGWGWLSGDVISFSSEVNNRYAYLLRSGSVIHIGEYLIKGSVWPILFPGKNTFAFTSPASLKWRSMSHSYNYWGV